MPSSELEENSLSISNCLVRSNKQDKVNLYGESLDKRKCILSEPSGDERGDPFSDSVTLVL